MLLTTRFASEIPRDQFFNGYLVFMMMHITVLAARPPVSSIEVIKV